MYLKPQSDPKLVLDIRGADRKAGAKVILYANKGDFADNQLWYEDERCVIRSKINNFAMDGSGNSFNSSSNSFKVQVTHLLATVDEVSYCRCL